MRKSLAVVVLLGLGFVAWSLRPVCVPLSAEDLRGFNVPIEERTDRDFYLKVFQRRDGQWHQCKTWLARQFFF
ncbi:MAG: hypothetical protein ACM3SV_03085 [Betaproteobacteria bacterium]